MGKKKLGGLTSLILRLGDNATTVPSAAAASRSSSSSSTTTTKPAAINPSWAWPSCKKQQQQQLRTDFGAAAGAVDESSVYFDSTDSLEFTHSSEDNNSESFSTTSDHDNVDVDDSETLIRGLVRSSDHRLFVEPGGDTSSILEAAEPPAKGRRAGGTAGTTVMDMDMTMINPNFKERSVAMAMESHDPYLDFKKSMEEMVAAHGLKDWDCLEELLVWYLRVNGKKTHGYIVGAFVDLLVGLAAAAAAADDGHDDDLLLPSSSSCCGSSSLSLSSSRNCYEIEEVLEDRSC